MIITLIGHEKNLGILTLTDHLISKLGKDQCSVLGWNYLISDANTRAYADKINEATQSNKSVIIKYIIPRNNFSNNQEIVYPNILKDLSDVVFRVPTYREEISVKVPKIFFKGSLNPMIKYIDEFYSPAP